jgi:hypothetical protein
MRSWCFVGFNCVTPEVAGNTTLGVRLASLGWSTCKVDDYMVVWAHVSVCQEAQQEQHFISIAV